MREPIVKLVTGSLLCACLQACGPEAGAPSVYETPIVGLQQMLANGEVTSIQLVEQYLARIEAYDRAGPRLNSIVRVNPAARDSQSVVVSRTLRCFLDQSEQSLILQAHIPW